MHYSLTEKSVYNHIIIFGLAELKYSDWEESAPAIPGTRLCQGSTKNVLFWSQKIWGLLFHICLLSMESVSICLRNNIKMHNIYSNNIKVVKRHGKQYDWEVTQVMLFWQTCLRVVCYCFSFIHETMSDVTGSEVRGTVRPDLRLISSQIWTLEPYFHPKSL